MSERSPRRIVDYIFLADISACSMIRKSFGSVVPLGIEKGLREYLVAPGGYVLSYQLINH
jgi:hypothetical protein